MKIFTFLDHFEASLTRQNMIIDSVKKSVFFINFMNCPPPSFSKKIIESSGRLPEKIPQFFCNITL